MVKKKRNRNEVEMVIYRFGGLRIAARSIGRAPSAVHRWRKNKRIPLSAMMAVTQALNLLK